MVGLLGCYDAQPAHVLIQCLLGHVTELVLDDGCDACCDTNCLRLQLTIGLKQTSEFVNIATSNIWST